MAQLNFDATQHTPDTGFETIPAGWYNAMIDESELKPTRDGSGAYLQVRFNVMDGQYAGRKVFTRLNIRNMNPTAQEIAFKQLSAIAHAVGVLQVQDSAQLHGAPLKIKVKVRKDTTGQYEDSNEISAFKNINETVDMASPVAASGFAASNGFAPQTSQPMNTGFQQPAAQQAPVQQVAQPWAQPAAQQQAPQQAPAQQQWQQPAQQQQAPVEQQPAAQQWQQPASAQPWAAAPQGQPMQTQQPVTQQQQPAQQQHPAQSATPPWAVQS